MVRLANEIEAERNTPSVNYGGIGNALSRGIKRLQVTVDFSQANSMSEMAASGKVRLANGWEVNLDEENIELLKQRSV